MLVGWTMLGAVSSLPLTLHFPKEENCRHCLSQRVYLTTTDPVKLLLANIRKFRGFAEPQALKLVFLLSDCSC